eukprot:g54577.t1
MTVYDLLAAESKSMDYYNTLGHFFTKGSRSPRQILLAPPLRGRSRGTASRTQRELTSKTKPPNIAFSKAP